MAWQLYNDDIMKYCEAYSKDGQRFQSLLCDPPYNLDTIKKRFGKENSAPAKFGTDGVFARSSRGFMGKEWDNDVAFDPELWSAISRLLCPGAFCMAFSSTRTYHRMATAIEQAGFVIHPMIGWINGSGFPKATRVKDGGDTWEGYRYGLQALKPSFEPICVFQKPFEGRPIDCIKKYGAGALNIDGARIGDEEVTVNVLEQWSGLGQVQRPDYESTTRNGRYPANVVISGDVDLWYSKFFYCAKASRSERDAGLEDMPDTVFGQSGGAQSKLAQGEEEYLQDSIGLNRIKRVKNPHPTVKPIDLIKHLATLLRPPAEYKSNLLVPFAGSGSEMIGALLAGWNTVIGIEIEKESCEIAVKRIKHWTKEEK
jgi:site-specific DNA-methyltransferase (adenine-specific)